MTVIFHINGNGDVGRCTATKGGCPFGGDDDHYDNPRVARIAAERMLKDNTINQKLVKLPKVQKDLIVRVTNRYSDDDKELATFIKVTSIREDKVYFTSMRKYNYSNQSIEKFHNPSPGELNFSGDRQNMSKEKFDNLLRKRLAGVVSEPSAVVKQGNPKFSPEEAQKIYDEAHAAGMAAGTALVPDPMTVTERVNPWDDNSPVKNSYFVPEGVCGFAWVVIRPANSSFGRWLKQNGKASGAYGGGLQVWVRQFGQSYEKKSAYATAFANVLKKYEIKAYSDGRLD